MSTGDIILAPQRRSYAEDEDEDDLALPGPTALGEALAWAQALSTAAWQARLRREDIARKLATESGRQPFAFLPLALTLLLSASAALAALAIFEGLPLPPSAYGSIEALALRLDIAVLGVSVAVALRQAADRSRPRPGRVVRLAIGLVALAGLAALAADAATVHGLVGAGKVAAVAGSAALPWLFARLTTGEASRLGAELKAASTELADAEAELSGAMAAARLAFDDELAVISAGPILRSASKPPTMPGGSVGSHARFRAGSPGAVGEAGGGRFVHEPWREEERP